MHDPEDAEAAAGGDGVAGEGDDESEEEEGRGDIADGAESYSSRKQRGGGELYEGEEDRRSDPEFCGLAHNWAFSSPETIIGRLRVLKQERTW